MVRLCRYAIHLYAFGIAIVFIGCLVIHQTNISILSTSAPNLSLQLCAIFNNHAQRLFDEYKEQDILPQQLRNFTEMVAMVNRRHIPYGLLLLHSCNKSLVLRVTKEPRDLNIFIFVHNRTRNAAMAVRFMIRAINSTKVVAKVILIEMNARPFLEYLTNQLVEYIFIPLAIAQAWGCGSHYPNSLLKNLGYIFAKQATWVVFHDVDLLVDKDFIAKVWNNKTPNRWMHTYSSWCGLSDRQMASFEAGHTSFKRLCTAFKPTGVGGSLFMPATLFENSGGYDPELFCGWAPEDLFFMEKLRFLFGVEHRIPVATLYHQPHTIQTQQGGLYGLTVVNSFKALRDEEKLVFCNLKKELLLSGELEFGTRDLLYQRWEALALQNPNLIPATKG